MWCRKFITRYPDMLIYPFCEFCSILVVRPDYSDTGMVTKITCQNLFVTISVITYIDFRFQPSLFERVTIAK